MVHMYIAAYKLNVSLYEKPFYLISGDVFTNILHIWYNIYIKLLIYNIYAPIMGIDFDIKFL